MCDNIINLKVDELLYSIYERPDFKKLAYDLNINDQLFKKGIDSEGKSLGQYAPSTKKAKQRKGQPSDHITLKDTGTFYDSFDITPDDDGFWMLADGNKDGVDLFQRFGQDVLGLTDDNFEPLKQIIIEELYKLIAQKINEGL